MSKSAVPSRVVPVLLAATAIGAVGCADRPPFVVLTVEDPLAVATGFVTLHVGFERGELRPVKVNKSAFPLGVTVTAAKAGPHELWVEARDAGGVALGRGHAEARLRSDGTPTANIQLAKACDTDPDCSDSLFCTGSETCGEGMCASAGNPCAANVECAQSTCVELGMGDGRCDVTVDHQLCGPGAYCDLSEGCVVAVCGDSRTEVLGGEECDDGNQNPYDGCDECRIAAWRAEAIIGTNRLATAVGLNYPTGVAVDRFGNVFVADNESHRVRKVAAGTGVITTVAGTGAEGSSGDGGQATSARLYWPQGVAVDGLGNLFVADSEANRVRKVAWDTGVITTVAGTGTAGSSGDNGPATSAQLHYPYGVAVDGLGNLFVADRDNHRIRKVAAGTGIITTVAGTGTAGFSGDNGQAASAQLYWPSDVAVDGFGNLFVADSGNDRIRKVARDTGVITTVAGTGTAGFSGDNGQATSAELDYPEGVAVDGLGNVFAVDAANNRIRKVAWDTGIITTVAGTGVRGFSGDNGQATSAQLRGPAGVAVDGLGNLFVADCSNHRIRKVAWDTGVITTVAGTGAAGSSGDGGEATSAQLLWPCGVAADGLGNVFVADCGNDRIHKVAPGGGAIITVAGVGTRGFSGDGGEASSAQLSYPSGVAVDALGNLFLADRGNHRIRKVARDTGIITTVAGTGTPGFSGDNGPAASAQLDEPTGVAVDGLGNVFVADTENQRIRKVAAGSGVITTVAGTGAEGFSGDGGQATNAQLRYPYSVAVDGLGNLFVADADNNRIRKVAAGTGVITTAVGTGTYGFSGDGGQATSAELSYPEGVAVDGLGNLFVADSDNLCIRKVAWDTGVITTVAGTGMYGAAGDGGQATSAELSYPEGVAVNGLGDLFVADAENNRIRKVAAGTGIITTVAGQVFIDGMGAVAQARLGDPRTVVLGADGWLFAGGASGTVQQLDAARTSLRVVAGRYAHTPATGNLARFRDQNFGSVGGVAFDAAAGLVYLTETTFNRLHVVSPVDPDNPNTWTIAPLAGDAASGLGDFVDGAAAGARFRAPAGLFLDTSSQALYIADTNNHVVRLLDLATGQVSTPIGVGETLGFIGDEGLASEALLFAPEAVTRCANGDIFVADTGNNRVRRVHRVGADDFITTVLGDGTGASSGEGFPAWTFPVEEPRGLMCDSFGNLYVTSTSTVRMLPATDAGVVDGEGPVQTIYGGPPRTGFPASISECLTGLYVTDDDHVFVTDACEGLFVELWSEVL